MFTTHTPVPAGIDRFDRDAGRRAPHRHEPALPAERILELGAEDDPTIFNMAHMGLRLGQRANGVSLLHGEVSREMFADLWPGFDTVRGADHLGHQRRARARPGCRARSSSSPSARSARPCTTSGGGWDAVDKVGDAELWGVRNLLRARLVDEIRRRMRESALQRGMSAAELGLDRRRPSTRTC